MLLKQICKALEALPFWMAYKNAKYWQNRIPEAAIVAELRELLIANILSDARVRCEVAFSEIKGEMKKKVAGRGRPEQVDIAIQEKAAPKRFLAVMEIKLGNRIDRLGNEDLVALSLLKKRHPKLRTFFLMVSECRRPVQGLAKNLSADRKVRLADNSINIVVRRATKAFGGVPANNSHMRGKKVQEFWAVLFEIV